MYKQSPIIVISIYVIDMTAGCFKSHVGIRDLKYRIVNVLDSSAHAAEPILRSSCQSATIFQQVAKWHGLMRDNNTGILVKTFLREV